MKTLPSHISKRLIILFLNLVRVTARSIWLLSIWIRVNLNYGMLKHKILEKMGLRYPDCPEERELGIGS